MPRSTSSTVAAAPVLGLVLGLGVALSLTPACGGAVGANLGGEGTGKTDSGSGSGSGGAEDSGTTETDAGQPTIDAVAILDVSMPTVDATPVEEPPPPTGPAVLCPMNGNPSNCQPGELCCVVGSAMQGNQTDTCTSGGATCSGVPIQCAATADCPMGEVCCGSQTSAGMPTYTQVNCAASCSATNNQRTFCDPQANDCPTGTICRASQLLPGYHVCQ